jgi:hypothetical protein
MRQRSLWFIKEPRLRRSFFNGANQADIPTIGGEYINYSHPKTFDAPCLQGEYESGIVKICKGERGQTLDFNKGEIDYD